jgi:hypothetical protein
MSESNGVRGDTGVRPGFGLTFEAVGGGAHLREDGADCSMAVFLRSGAQQLFIDLLRNAKLADRRWKGLLVKGFHRSTRMPVLSGFVAEEHGVKVRFRPEKGGIGWIVVLTTNDPAGPWEAAARRLEEAAGYMTGDRVRQEQDPSSPGAVADAVNAVAWLESRGRRWASFDTFVGAVAEHAGADEPPSFWRLALASAQQQGLLHAGSNCLTLPRAAPFSPAKPEPPAVKRVTPIPGTSPPVGATVVTSPAMAQAVTRQATPEPFDAAAVDLILEAAEGLEARLKRLRALKNERADLANQRTMIDRRLADNETEIKALAGELRDATVAEAAQLVG